MKIYNKLVRDKITDIIEADGRIAKYRILDENEYRRELNKKLQEEVKEYLEDNNVEELADIVEVIYGILNSTDVSIKEFEKIRINKQEKRGAFEKKNLFRGDRVMDKLMQEINKFNEERDWDQFHSPENLAKSISIEAGELLECFQWDSENYNKDEVCEELADVFTYCIQMAMKLGVNPEEIILKKLDKTRKKYPVEKAKGVSTKYNKL